jgi:hypothetical protein
MENGKLYRVDHQFLQVVETQWAYKIKGSFSVGFGLVLD